MPRKKNVLLNFMLGLSVISMAVLAAFLFWGKLQPQPVLDVIAGFLPAILIALALVSALVVILKVLTKLIRYLRKTI